MIRIGTSGYNYPEWKGRFYPADLPAARMLEYYAGRFRTVEINYTFYRMPSEKTLAGWASRTPDDFVLTLKAPRAITHDRRLADTAEVVDVFAGRARTLGERLGIVLFQLPPSLRCNLELLDRFLASLPAGLRATMEFRHPSWYDEDVFARLRARNVALCIADSEDRTTPLVATADFGYFRLRDEGYDERALSDWAERMRDLGRGWQDTFVYFKHEDEGKGPELAAALETALGISPAGGPATAPP